MIGDGLDLQDPGSGTPTKTPPPGFAFDPKTGLYLGPGGNLSWDPNTGTIGYPNGQTQPPVTKPGPPAPPPPGPPEPPGPDPLTKYGTFNAPSPVNLGGPAGIPYIPPTPEYTAPGYTPPPAFSYPDFVGPNAETVMNRPGYAFRRDQGKQMLLNDRAHSGLLNTGGTLKDLVNYGEDYATNEFGNEWNRDAAEYTLNRANAVGTYNTNYQTQFQDPYTIARQGSLDAFAPKLTGYTTQAQAGQRQSELDWSRAFDLANFDWTKFRNLFDMKFQYANT